MIPSRKAVIGAAFGRAAATYDRHAAVQEQAATALAALIAGLDLPPAPRLLEIGCGTGLLTGHLAQLPGAHGLITDLSPAMVQACRARIGGRFCYAAMDGEAPSLTARFHLICASLAIQWFDRPAPAIAALHDLLVPGGFVCFSTLGPASLAGWRAAHAIEGLAPPTPVFADPAAFLQAWPGEARLARATIDIAHGNGRAFLAALRGIGAHTPAPGHRKLHAGELRRVLHHFERDHKAIASYEIVHACLRA